MSRLGWIFSILSAPFLRERDTPLVRPARLDWNPSLCPQTIQVKGHTISYVVKGVGRPLVLIHGYGAGIWVWEKQIGVLSQGYKIYALDLIGHGFSDRPKIPYTPETYVDCLKHFMDGAGVEKATLVGNSMGGGVAWAMAILFAERVDRLVLIDCVPPDVLGEVKNESFRMLAAVKDIPFLPYLVMAVRNRNSIRKILLECLSDSKLITPEVVNRQYQLSRIKGTTWALYSTFKHAREALKLKDQFPFIRKPVLFLWGERDLVFPLQLGESLHRAIAGSELRLIKKSGHIPMWETPEEVNEAILDFLEE